MDSLVFTILLSFINQHLLTTYGVRDTEIKIDKGTKRDKGQT